MFKIIKSEKGFTLIELIVVVIIVAILAAFAVPTYFRNVERARSTEAQTALAAIRNAYTIHFQQFGSFDRYSIDDALEDVRIGRATMRNWRFEVVGNPPQRYVATSTSDFPGGEGHVVFYDVREARFGGWGIDEFIEVDF